MMGSVRVESQSALASSSLCSILIFHPSIWLLIKQLTKFGGMAKNQQAWLFRMKVTGPILKAAVHQ